MAVSNDPTRPQDMPQFQPGGIYFPSGTDVGLANGATMTLASGSTLTLASGSTLSDTSAHTVASGGSLTIANGATLSIAGANVPARVSAVAATNGSNVTKVTFTVKDTAGTAITYPYIFDVFLSDSAVGAGLTGTTASGNVETNASGGETIATLTAKKALKVQTLNTGSYVLSITDTAKTAFKVCAQLPGLAPTVVVTLATGDYG